MGLFFFFVYLVWEKNQKVISSNPSTIQGSITPDYNHSQSIKSEVEKFTEANNSQTEAYNSLKSTLEQYLLNNEFINDPKGSQKKELDKPSSKINFYDILEEKLNNETDRTTLFNNLEQNFHFKEYIFEEKNKEIIKFLGFKCYHPFTKSGNEGFKEIKDLIEKEERALKYLQNFTQEIDIYFMNIGNAEVSDDDFEKYFLLSLEAIFYLDSYLNLKLGHSATSFREYNFSVMYGNKKDIRFEFAKPDGNNTQYINRLFNFLRKRDKEADPKDKEAVPKKVAVPKWDIMFIDNKKLVN